ncbi:NPCBM/NEW2 domain-containing protein [Microbulbifer hainanensis]|uniref:NPCBM/NEW2 domain-containing protein n=1 Tax=Microbulbifer hainanensis TaxID=2735675 RepID=UPI00186962A2|nr:NPCBM/NEW2 domain-containing protein [Microbulbifer hainanensis]
MHSHSLETATAPGHRWTDAIAARLSPISLQLTSTNVLYAILYGLILAGAWLRIDYVLQFNPVDHLWSDPQRHWEQGIDALRADPMALTDPVLYQLYIGVLGKLTLKDPLLVAFYTALLSLCTPWVWYRFLRELQPSRQLATAGWAALSLLPSWIAIYGYFMQETLLLPLLGAALWASWRCRRKETLRSFLLMALLWALAGLTRGIAIPLAAVTCTWLWLEQGDKWRKAGYALLLLGLILGPLTVRGYQELGIFAPHGNGKLVSIYTRSGHKQINIHYRRGGERWNYWFASPSTGEKPLEPLSEWQTARRGAAEVNIDLDQGGEDWQRAVAEYPLTVSRYLWIARENLIYLFFGASWPDKNTERSLDRINIQMRWLWAPLTLLLFAASALYWRRLRNARLLAVLLLTWIFVQGLLPIAVNEGRYRKPAEGLLLAQAALLLSLRRHRGREAVPRAFPPHGPTVAALTAAGLLCCAGGSYLWQRQALANQFSHTGTLYLSQLDADYHRQGWGRLGLDKTVDRGPLKIHGHRYAHGLGVHAPSETRYRIPDGARYFYSRFGLDDDDGRRGLVQFKVLLDGATAYDSGTFAWGEPGEVLLPLDGADSLTLLVQPLGSRNYDHAVWAAAHFLAAVPQGADMQVEESTGD